MRMSPIDQPLMLMELLGHHPEQEQRNLADQRRGGYGYEASIDGRS